MLETISKDLFLVGAAASDVGVLDWLRISMMSGALVALLTPLRRKLAWLRSAEWSS
jgi:hypothetical protein